MVEKEPYPKTHAFFAHVDWIRTKLLCWRSLFVCY